MSAIGSVVWLGGEGEIIPEQLPGDPSDTGCKFRCRQLAEICTDKYASFDPLKMQQNVTMKHLTINAKLLFLCYFFWANYSKAIGRSPSFCQAIIPLLHSVFPEIS
jgi:hypothetical protein